MFRITKGGVTVGMTENPNYIRQQENGCFALCLEPLASGVVFEGTVYHLMGRDALESAETVLLEETDAGMEITKATETGGIMFVTMAEAGSIDDVTAAEHADFFSPWAYPVGYTKGNIRRYNGALYRCLSDHNSQADWTPDAAPSLWVGISDPAEECPVWTQPLGASDAYNAGAKVSHNSKHWISTTDGNVWEPGVYGWTEEAADGT